MKLLQRLGVSNVIGFLGLVLLVLAVIMLAGLWWGVLLLGVCLVVFAYLLGTDENQAADAGPTAAASGNSELAVRPGADPA